MPQGLACCLHGILRRAERRPEGGTTDQKQRTPLRARQKTKATDCHDRIETVHDERRRPELYPVLPLRDIVVFPYMIVPLFVGREKSIAALEEVMRTDKQILLVAQKNASDDEPSTDGIYAMGTLASVLQLLKLPDGTVKVLVEGTRRASIVRYTENENYFEAEIERVDETLGSEEEIEALVALRRVRSSRAT